MTIENRDPNLMHAAWEGYHQTVYGGKLTGIQYRETRAAFMCGAWSIFMTMTELAEKDLSEAAEAAFMLSLHRELQGVRHELGHGVYLDDRGVISLLQPQTLTSWAVFEHPTDHPDKWVGRFFVMTDHTTITAIADTREELEKKISELDSNMPARVFMAPMKGDVANLVGTWL